MRNLPRLLDQCFADPDNVPGLRSAVWQAALDSKLVRTRRTPRGTVIDIKRGRRWFDQGTSDTAWVRALAADPIIFGRLLRLALQHKPKRFDLLRRLRDLRRQPTYLRLRNLVRDAREYDRNQTGSNARRTATVVRCFNASRCPPGPFFRWTEGGIAPYTQ